MLLRIRPTNGWYCCARSSFGSCGGMPQSWPLSASASGGAPTDAPCAIQVTVRPGLRAGGIRADRDVAVQTDRHAELARSRLRLAQLLGREPLQVEEILDVLRALAREAIDDRRRRIAIVLRPARPAPVLRPLQPQMRVERIVDRMQPQRLRPASRRSCGTPGSARVLVLQVLACGSSRTAASGSRTSPRRRRRSRRWRSRASVCSFAWKSAAATRSRAASHSAKSGTSSTAMYSTLRNWRFDGLYGLMCAGFAGISACSGLRPTMPQPSGAA